MKYGGGEGGGGFTTIKERSRILYEGNITIHRINSS